MHEDISFGEWVRRRRHILDLTQQELADQVGCARITLRRIESRALKPSKELAQILLDKLGAPQSQRNAWLQFARGLSGFPVKADSFSSNSITNLPTSLTSFIGREKERVEIINLVSTYQLVTLVGAGGIGKTRLAIQVGQRLLNEYPNGVWFISLDSLSDPSVVPQTVAAIFDIREGSSDRPLIERLIYSLSTKTALLIFDNCEHLLEACAQLIITLLTNCPNLKVLVTGREMLNIEGEAIHYTSTLLLPDQAETSVQKISKHESIQLFTQRAALVLSSFQLTTDNMQATANICRRLDGIPLAIELAAARVDILQVNEILEQLDHHFDLLVSDKRGMIPRHQTMRASLDWSWNLLTESEQIFMRQLPVFASGWTLESAQAVCEGDVLNLISALVRKSLIVVNQETSRETRYHFHEIIRQYARERLIEAGEEKNVRERHLQYFLGLSKLAETALRGPAQMEWFARMHREHPNIRAALEYTIQNNDVEAGLYLSARLKRFWEAVDLKEGIRWLTDFTWNLESKLFPQARAKALYAQVIILIWLLQFERAHAAAQECLELYRQCQDRHGEADALLALANTTYQVNDVSQSVELGRQALALSESIGYMQRKAASLFLLGMYHYRYKHSFTYYLDQAISLYRQMKDWLSLSDCLSEVGHVALVNGELEAAEKYLKEAILLARQLKHKNWLGANLQIYGRAAFLQGDAEEAIASMKESIAISQEIGNRMLYLWSRSHLGYFTMWIGNINEAHNILGGTTREFLSENLESGVVFNLEGMARLDVTLAKPEVAARLIGWADATRQKISDSRPRLEQADVDKIIAACLAKMGEVDFSDAYEEGQKMTLDEAVELALKKVEEM
jgi:predicted ATPase/DNA-binding XRE family transcriptional regulator